MSRNGALRTRRRTTVLGALAVAGGLAGVAGCGIQSTGVTVVGAAPTLEPAGQIAGDQTAGGTGTAYKLFFFKSGRLEYVTRFSTSKSLDQATLINQVLAGPLQAEQNHGFYSAFDDQKLTLQTTSADNQEWAYGFNEVLDMQQKAEITCTVEADFTNATTSVGSAYGDANPTWYNCSDFAELYGAPLAFPLSPGTLSDSQEPTDEPSPASS